MQVLLSIDQSTQGTKGLVWGLDGTLLGRADVAHRQMIRENGWIGHDLEEIWDNVCRAARLALQRACVQPENVAVLGLSNQRETACAWNRQTGQPLYEAVVWQCGRAVAITDRLAVSGFDKTVCAKTGLMLSPYFSAPKYSWMLENVPAVAQAKENGTLCLGTVDSYLLYRMTAGKSFKTDYSNASRTGLLNLDTLRWDSELLDAYGLAADCLPEVVPSDSCFGYTTLDGLFPHPVAIHAILGDSHAALYAHHCVTPYSAKVTYGTGSSVMLNAGVSRPPQSEGVVTSLAWYMQGQPTYCIEGNINYTGAVISWLVQDMKLLESSAQSGRIAKSLPDNGGVYLVPAFSGLGAPYFKNSARAAILGMNRHTKPAHIVRAAEECIAYQISDVVDAIRHSIRQPFTRLCADGGPTKDSFLMQFQADILQTPLLLGRIEECSGAGAAYCAAVAAGITGEDALFANAEEKTVTPRMEHEERQRLLAGWHTAVQTVAGMADR